MLSTPENLAEDNFNGSPEYPEVAGILYDAVGKFAAFTWPGEIVPVFIRKILYASCPIDAFPAAVLLNVYSVCGINPVERAPEDVIITPTPARPVSYTYPEYKPLETKGMGVLSNATFKGRVNAPSQVILTLPGPEAIAFDSPLKIIVPTGMSGPMKILPPFKDITWLSAVAEGVQLTAACT